MKTFVVLHELCKIWSLARFHYELLCNRGQDLIESYLLVNFPQSRSALLLVLSEQMNQYFCSSTMKKTVFVTHINTRIHRDVLSVCCRSRMECCEMLWSGLWSSCFQSPCLPYYPGELLPIMDCTAGEAPTETFFGFRSIEYGKGFHSSWGMWKGEGNLSFPHVRVKSTNINHQDCKGPQTNMPKNVGSIKTWSAKMNSRHIKFCNQNLYFCWSCLHTYYVLRHIRLRSFAVLCG